MLCGVPGWEGEVAAAFCTCSRWPSTHLSQHTGAEPRSFPRDPGRAVQGWRRGRRTWCDSYTTLRCHHSWASSSLGTESHHVLSQQQRTTLCQGKSSSQLCSPRRSHFAKVKFKAVCNSADIYEPSFPKHRHRLERLRMSPKQSRTPIFSRIYRSVEVATTDPVPLPSWYVAMWGHLPAHRC